MSEINLKVPPKLQKNCPECGTRLEEVRWAEIPDAPQYMRNPAHHYPRLIVQPELQRTFHEYRFACPKCLKEWTYDSLWREWSQVPANSQFLYSWEKKLLILRDEKEVKSKDKKQSLLRYSN